LDARAHRGLTDVQGARRATEAAFAHDARKREELIGIHR
jgi:hypothetical protein